MGRIFVLCTILWLTGHKTSSSNVDFRSHSLYKGKRHFGGVGALPILIDVRENLYARPTVYPTKKTPHHAMTAFHTFTQGIKVTGDHKVYDKKFDYDPKRDGHHVYCHAQLNCKISFLSVRAQGSLPILMRGGAGYRFFDVVVKAKPHDKLSGTIRAYCRELVDDGLE